MVAKTLYLGTCTFISKLYGYKKINKFFTSRDYYLKILIAFSFSFYFKENFMILHPGIGGWTYEYSSDFIKGNTYENVENSNANLYLKNQIIEMTPR